MARLREGKGSVYSPDFELNDDSLDKFLEEGEDPISIESDEAASGEMPSVLTTYLSTIASYPLLTAEQEKSLFTTYNEGRKAQKLLDSKKHSMPSEKVRELKRLVTIGRDAKEKIINANLRWVVKIAKYFLSERVDPMDVIQDGNMGLMKAVEGFDVSRGFRFTTYSFWTIRLAITHGSGMQSASTISLPYHIIEKKNKIDAVSSSLQIFLNRTPTKSEIADEMNISIRVVSSILAYAAKPISLDNVATVGINKSSSASGQYGEFNPIEDVIDSGCDVTEDVFASMANDELLWHISCLTERKRFIIERRYGFYDGSKWTLKKIGEAIGLTRERVRQLAAEALAEIKEADGYGSLYDWADGR